MWTFISLLAWVVAISETYTPIVMWHGLTQSSDSLNEIKQKMEETLPGVYIHNLKIGNNTQDEIINGFLMHPNRQVEIVCDIIRSDPLLANGYNAIGISQSAPFMRAVIQRCPSPPIKNFISYCGPHHGIYGVSYCLPFISFCDRLRLKANEFVYSSTVQNSITVATYWHNPLDENAYRNGSTFLADINNENEINQAYIDNLQQLENIVFIKYQWEQVIIPVETTWFGFYKPGQSEQIAPLQDLEVYTRLGLDEMDREGKLHFLTTPGYHGTFDWDWLIENIIEYLNK